MKRILTFLLSMLLLIPAAVAEEDEIIRPKWPTPDYVTLLLDTARAEIGYKEGAHGYSKYGDYWGDPQAQWCAEFLCWCVDQVDKNHGTQLLKVVYPLYSGQNTGKNWFIKQGRYITRNGNLTDWGYQWYKGADDFLTFDPYIPQPGDWVFFTWTSDENTGHVAMVEYCTRDAKGNVSVHVIEGNNPVAVARNVYSLNDKKILGYGTVHDVADWTMRHGNSGAKVTELQEKMIYLGLLPEGSATGYYGSDTVSAIQSYQARHGLKEYGIANIETQRLLNAEYEAKRFSDPSAWTVAEEDDDYWE